MTGLLDRLRTWLGGVFGGASDVSGEDGDRAPSSEGPSPRVVHRDDRPLETPSTLETTEPPTVASTDRAHAEESDAETEAARESTTHPETVSIPDAEAGADASATTAGAETDRGTTGTVANASEPNPETRTDAATETGTDDPRGAGAEAGGSVACSVCGTTVDDPTEPCPLCRSTDVVPVADASAEGTDEPLTRGGRTTASTGDDDEAVDRLRDVQDGE